MYAIARNVSLLAGSLLLASSALCATSNGNTSADDVRLGGFDSDAFVFTSGWNPHAGPNGDTSGFGSAFDASGSGPWSLLDKYDFNAVFSNAGVLQFGFAFTTGTTGTWSVHNTDSSNKVLDLVFAVHAGDGGAGFLFDNQAINAGQTLDGTWRIEWFTGQNSAYPDFSNLTMFARDVAAVPEPGEYAMLLAGLALLGSVARRRKGSDYISER